jgi:hypothetical protein
MQAMLKIIEVSTHDGLVKSRKIPLFVIPVKTGIQLYQMDTAGLDSGFHRSDDFLRDHQLIIKG